MIELKFKKLVPEAIVPSYTRDADACMDITSIEETIIPAGQHRTVGTGLSCAIPEGWEMQIRGRSGLAAKHGVGVVQGIGTIDSEYRGELKIILVNNGKDDFKIEKGMRIAQFALFKVNKILPVEVKELSNTIRGSGGFGSSGLK